MKTYEAYKKVKKYGNALVITIDKGDQEIAQIKEGDVIKIVAKGEKE